MQAASILRGAYHFYETNDDPVTQAQKIPSSWKSWTFWQSSQSGSVAGVIGSVDTDVFAGFMSDLLNLIEAG